MAPLICKADLLSVSHNISARQRTHQLWFVIVPASGTSKLVPLTPGCPSFMFLCYMDVKYAASQRPAGKRAGLGQDGNRGGLQGSISPWIHKGVMTVAPVTPPALITGSSGTGPVSSAAML